jgi:Ser/Thr protein kinase RdoA (MazF antagonist)
MGSNPQLSSLLSRTLLRSDFHTFITFLEHEFPVGIVKNITPIMEGYEAANIQIETTIGKFVIKIFESDRNITNIHDTILVLTTLKEKSIPSTELVKGTHGYLGTYPEQENIVYFILLKFFEGKSFEEIVPAQKDINQIAKYLGLLNNLKIQIVSAYDSWGIRHFVEEFDKHAHKLTQDELSYINDIVEKMRHVQFLSLPQAFIHGDMQKKHVLINAKNEYCILDFGCMANDARLIEIATFIAWFCFDENNWDKSETIIKEVLQAYEETQSLTSKEKELLPLFIRASYAAYFLKTSCLMKDGDRSEETMSWNSSAERMLQRGI